MDKLFYILLRLQCVVFPMWLKRDILIGGWKETKIERKFVGRYTWKLSPDRQYDCKHLNDILLADGPKSSVIKLHTSTTPFSPYLIRFNSSATCITVMSHEHHDAIMLSNRFRVTMPLCVCVISMTKHASMSIWCTFYCVSLSSDTGGFYP